MATPAAVTGTAAAPAPTMGTAATHTPATGAADAGGPTCAGVGRPYTKEDSSEVKVSLFSKG